MLCFEGPLQFQLQLPSCMFSACVVLFVPIYALRPVPVKGSCLWASKPRSNNRISQLHSRLLLRKHLALSTLPESKLGT